MTQKKFYVTTPIYYANSNPHIGSAYTTIVADIIARYKRFCDYDVYFLTGTDEHGQKIMETAKSMGKTPIELCDELAGNFESLWKDLEITNNDFIRTTQERHEKVVQSFVGKMIENGDIYKGNYEGWYCIPDETFYLEEDIEVIDGKKCCPSCKRELRWVSEENYFFRLSAYQNKLLELYNDNPEFMEPAFRRNEMLRIIEGGLKDLSISRTTFNWGVPLPGDDKHVIYVWVDALINYISALGYSTDNHDLFDKYWPADLHLIGKEINRFHSIIWPAMLMSVGLPLPKKVFAHGWLTFNGEKISKSTGNAIDPRILMDAYGKDAVKYYLLRDINFGRDGDFSEDGLIGRINADLANDLGNLIHRTSAMINQNFEGRVPNPGTEETETDLTLKKLLEDTKVEYIGRMEKYQFTQALEAVWKLISFTNKYIDLNEPWKLAKDENQRGRLATVLYNLGDSLRNVALFLLPIMTDTSKELFLRLGYDYESWKNDKIEDIEWRKLVVGNTVKSETPLFPRIDVKTFEKVVKMEENKKTEVKEEAVEAKAEVKKEAKEEKPEGVELIGFDTFTKVQLKVAEVVEAEKVKKSKKLIKLQLNIGESENRQIVAGVSQFYEPEQLIGKKIIIVANLKPAKLMGIESNGMLLAAKDGGNLRLLTVDGEIMPGAKIS